MNYKAIIVATAGALTLAACSPAPQQGSVDAARANNNAPVVTPPPVTVPRKLSPRSTPTTPQPRTSSGGANTAYNSQNG